MDILTYGLLNKKVEEAKNVSGEKITEAVNTYLDENPPTTGATAEQAEQIQDNTNKITELKGDIDGLSLIEGIEASLSFSGTPNRQNIKNPQNYYVFNKILKANSAVVLFRINLIKEIDNYCDRFHCCSLWHYTCTVCRIWWRHARSAMAGYR